VILKKLMLKDFGLFLGENNIDLEPRIKYGHKRPIVLFGGLNGAGKTTTLTAIRLALYGRQSIGRSVSNQAYHQYLMDSIHLPSNHNEKLLSSTICLEFSFGRQGRLSEYEIIRSWSVKNKSVLEQIEIKQDGEMISGLTADQKQAFLNELIPIGVADLFFFDGEKIASLAEDDDNLSLADAINRLLGLDIIDRLKADLGVYLRDQKRERLPSEVLKEISRLEKEYEEQHHAYQSKLTEITNYRIESTDYKKDAEKLKQNINDLGGAWAKSRQAEEVKVGQLTLEREELKNKIKELLSDAAPLAIAKKQFDILQKQLVVEQGIKRQMVLDAELKSHLKNIRSVLISKLGESKETIIDDSINQTLSAKQKIDGEIIHDISDTDFNFINNILTEKVPQQQKELKNLSRRLDIIERDLELSGINIARAPDERRITDYVNEFSKVENTLGEIKAKIRITTEEAKRYLRNAMDTLRKLRDKEAEYSKNTNMNKAVALAENTRHLLSEFAIETKAKKIELLEQEFIKSFSKLVRKDDMQINAKIDANNFSVTLIDNVGNKVDKKKLSAGEKQIYAIAMLEALGRTSGRNLPIIIDTPLGRLDSNHRNNLVNNYFPTASHQVMILSTDTEIDEDFYRDLSPEISHAYSVDYNSNTGSSTYNEGYFWRSNN
jgi:DNA sulfur modification protein DndD